MRSLDPFSVSAMTQLTAVLVTLTTFLAWKINSRVPGMRQFALGLLALSAGSVASAARVFIPGAGIVALCNLLMVGGLLAISQALRKFRGFPPLPWALLASVLGAVAPLFLYWLVVNEKYSLRVALISPLCALISLDCAASSFRQAPVRGRVTHWPIGAVFSFSALYLTARTVAALAGLYDAGRITTARLEIVSGICSNISFIGVAFSMMLASNMRLRISRREH